MKNKIKYIALFSLLLLSFLLVLPVIAQKEEKFEYFHEWNDGTYVYSAVWLGQTFTPQTSHDLTKVVLYGYRYGNPSGNFIVSIKNTDIDGKPAGEDLVSKNMTAMDISEEEVEIEILFDTQISLGADTKYAIVCRCPDGDIDNGIVTCFLMEEKEEYPRGSCTISYDIGETWEIHEELDLWFEEWGYEEVASPSMNDALIPFLPVIGIAFGVAFVALFFTLAIYYSNPTSEIPFEKIIVPLFAVISVCSCLLVIGIFGL
jgi:hypothetical protein